MADLLLRLPEIPAEDAPTVGTPWRSIVTRMLSSKRGALIEQVHSQVASRRRQFDSLEVRAQELARACHMDNLCQGRWEGLEGFMLQEALVDRRSPSLRREISLHYAELQALLIECLPLQSSGNAAPRRVYSEWSHCVSLLRVLRNALTDAAASAAASPQLTQWADLGRLQQVWRRAAAWLTTARRPTRPEVLQHAAVDCDWDGFMTRPSAWLAGLGAPGAPGMYPLAEAADEDRDVLMTSHETEWVASEVPEWPDAGLTAATLPECLQRVSRWSLEATRARTLAQRLISSTSFRERADLLSKGSFREWAKRMRPARAFQAVVKVGVGRRSFPMS